MSVYSTRCLAVLAIVAAAALAPLDTAFAAQYYVSKGGSDANSCTNPAEPCLTIQAAVNKAGDGSQIFLSPGTYAECIQINGRKSLGISGTAGVVLAPPEGGDPYANHILNVWSSQNIEVRNVVFQGGGSSAFGGVAAGDVSGLRFHLVTVQDMGGGGIVFFRNASGQITSSAVRRNRMHGVRVDASSDLVIGSPNPAETVVIEDNPYQGIAVSGVVNLRGNVLVQRNGYGVFGNGGRLNSCCEEGTASFIDNEVQGIRMTGGYMDLRGPARIEGNPLGGIRLIGTTAYLNLWSSSDIVLRNNGNAGIHLAGSYLEATGLDVSDNLSRGILLQDASAARIWNVTITGNSGEGIRAEGHSVIRLVAPATVNGNGVADLSCSRNSSGVGDASFVGKLLCADFEKLK